MRQFLVSVVTIFYASVSFGQTITRQDNESVEAFVNRIKPDSTVLAHPPIETTTWDSTKKAIIAFYGYHESQNPVELFHYIFGHLYLPVGKNEYRDISFGPMEEDGGWPEILSVSFANADKDKSKELIVLCKLDQNHYDYDGTFYETYIFDNPSQKTQLTFLKKLSDKFYGCECGWRDGRVEKAKYKTAKAVKAGLVKMGYKQ